MQIKGNKSIVVIGVGQTLRGDDAIGVLAVQAWQTSYRESANHPQVRVEICELPGLGLLDRLSGAENALIVDAVNNSGPDGKIYVLDEQAISSFDGGARSAHGWGVAETIQLGRKLNKSSLPAQIRIIGVEAKCFNIGESPCPEIVTKLPQIVATIEGQVHFLLADLE